MTSTRYQILLAGGLFDFETRSIVPPDRSTEAWQVYQAWLTAGNSPLPPSTIGQDTLPVSKLKRQAEIDAYAAGLRNRAVRGRSAGEMASWTAKLVEARAYQSTLDPLQAPLLQMIATVRGISVADLAVKVIAQATPFLQAEAYIDGIRGKHCDAIEAMLDVRDIITYDWLTGWPAIP
jgi:hypothetical protein